MKINIPELLDKKYGDCYYYKVDFDNFISSINYIPIDIKGMSLYLSSKVISQNKLREAGFSIVRDKNKADVVVIEDFKENMSRYNYSKQNNYNIREDSGVEEFLDKYSDNDLHILNKDLYKYLYKYEGNQELFYNCKELFNSKSNDNVKMAMEFISNANWTGNDIYIRELFNLFWNNGIRGNTYKNGISFKGFLNSLDFNYESQYLSDANDYRVLCKNDEHHNWIYKKYEEEFKEELDCLFKKHKIKLDKIEFSIDKSIIYEDSLEEG